MPISTDDSRERGRRSSLGTAIVTVMLTLGLGACSGGSGSSFAVDVPEIVFGPESNVDSRITPPADGFEFANFTAGQLPELAFDANEIVEMFGDGPEICASGGADDCQLSAEAAAWAQMVNDARQSGHCEGFAVQAMSRWNAAASPPTGELQLTEGVVEAIMRGFASQFIDEVRAEAAAWRKHRVRDIVAAVTDSLRDGKPNYVLGIYGDGGGHAVLPYKVEFDGDRAARLWVYDSNWPGENRFVDVDLIEDTWRFSFDGVDPAADTAAWTGGKGKIDLASLESRIGGRCPFCDDGAGARATILVIRSAAPGWSVTTQGTSVDATTLEGDGVTATPTRAGLIGLDEYVVTVEASAIDDGVTVSVPATAVVHAVTPAGVVRAQAPGSGASFALDGRSVRSPSAGASVRLAAGNLAGESTGATSEVTVEGDTLALRATSDDGQTQEFVVDDTNSAARLIVRHGDNLPSGTVSQVVTAGAESGSTILSTFADGTSDTASSDDAFELTPLTLPPPAALRGQVKATRLAGPRSGTVRIVPGTDGDVESEGDKGNSPDSGGGGSNDPSGDNVQISQPNNNGARIEVAMTWSDLEWNALQLANVYRCGDEQPRLHVHVNNATSRVKIKVLDFPGGPTTAQVFDGDSVDLIFPKLSVNKTFDVTIRASSTTDGVVEVRARAIYQREGCPAK